MTGHRSKITDKVYNPKTGKLIDKPPKDVSAKIRQRRSKKQRVVRRTP